MNTQTRTFPVIRLKLVAALTLLALTSSCSLSHQPPALDSKLAAAPLTIDLFSARGFLGGSDYEHYRIENDLVWRECGNIAGSSSKMGLLGSLRDKTQLGSGKSTRDPNLIRVQSAVEDLTSSQKAELKVQTDDLLGKLSSEKSLPYPGSVFALSGPGLFELQVKLGNSEQHVITSVDAIADPSSKSLGAANKLFELVRGIGPVICHSQTFFGVRRGTFAKADS